MTDAKTLDETLLWLCSIASPIGEESALCDAVSARLSKLPLAAPIRRYGNSIVVPMTRDADPKCPHIALVGHLDTVRTENGPARIEGDRCFGSGSSDMKSGLAVMVVLAEKYLHDTHKNEPNLAANLTLVFYAREEGPFAENELGPVLDADPELKKVDLAVCLEPSDNRLHLGCNGSIHATLTFEGKTGHSARPWEAVNAVHAAASFLTDMAKLEPDAHGIDGLTYRTVTSVTQAATQIPGRPSRGRNVVPDVFTLNVNHRFAPDTSLDEAQANVRALVGDRAKIEFTDLSPSCLPNASHPLVIALANSGVRGTEPKQAWTDVARFAQIGVPAINFGPGENAQAHQKNESTSLALLHEGFAIVERWLTSIASVAMVQK